VRDDGRVDIDGLLRDLPPWQARFMDAMLSGDLSRVQVPSGRANGHRTAQRLGLLGSVLMTGHIHVAGRDGLWCVTGDPRQVGDIGPLWEKLRQPGR
jgi:hypothetical protein